MVLMAFLSLWLITSASASSSLFWSQEYRAVVRDEGLQQKSQSSSQGADEKTNGQTSFDKKTSDKEADDPDKEPVGNDDRFHEESYASFQEAGPNTDERTIDEHRKDDKIERPALNEDGLEQTSHASIQEAQPNANRETIPEQKDGVYEGETTSDDDDNSRDSHQPSRTLTNGTEALIESNAAFPAPAEIIKKLQDVKKLPEGVDGEVLFQRADTIIDLVEKALGSTHGVHNEILQMAIQHVDDLNKAKATLNEFIDHVNGHIGGFKEQLGVIGAAGEAISGIFSGSGGGPPAGPPRP